MYRITFAFLAFLLLALVTPAHVANAQITFTVTSSIDLGDNVPGDGICESVVPPGAVAKSFPVQCSLRAAIEEANVLAGVDTIRFALTAGIDCDITSGVCVIQPDSPLPQITDTLVIDGESQLGATCGTRTIASGPSGTYTDSGFASRDLKIVLDGTNAGSSNGLELTSSAGGSVISGLVINRFGLNGIKFVGTDNAKISCNNIGTDATGMTDLGNAGDGIYLEGAATGNVMGTDGDGQNDGREGNVISGNTQNGINLSTGSNNSRVSGNYLGFNSAATDILGNTGSGFVMHSLNGLVLGTNGDGVSDLLESNVIVGNLRGVGLNRGANNRVAGNFIGTDLTGVPALGNLNEGVFIVNNANSSFVGRDQNGSPGEANEGNVIAFNGADGVDIRDTAVRIAVLGNRIYSNANLGIDLGNNGATANDAEDPDTGQNNLQNFPEIDSYLLEGGDSSVRFKVDTDTANATYPMEVEFFEADGDGEEGMRFLFAVSYTETDWGSGCGSPPCLKFFSFLSDVFELAIGDLVVATATDDNGNTSEFSAPIQTTLSTCPRPIFAKVFLEGAYNATNDKMNTDLVDAGQLPLSQPFADSAAYFFTPIYYPGPLTVTAIPDSAVDWVLTSLRTTPAPLEEYRIPALISENGVLFSPGRDSLCIPDEGPDNYYLIVRSRNHIEIMSSSAIDLTGTSGSWDFTTAVTQAYPGNDASAQKELETGVWGMFAADGTVDGQVTASDFNDWLVDTKAVATGYLQTDFDLDAQVTASDFNLWLVNTKAVATSKVP
ncbi:MAG: hypothetical protein ACC655_00620 [Rhodothermia bacterium]